MARGLKRIFEQSLELVEGGARKSLEVFFFFLFWDLFSQKSEEFDDCFFGGLVTPQSLNDLNLFFCLDCSPGDKQNAFLCIFFFGVSKFATFWMSHLKHLQGDTYLVCLDATLNESTRSVSSIA